MMSHIFRQISDGLCLGHCTGSTSNAIIRTLRSHINFDLRFIGPVCECSYRVSIKRIFDW